MKRAEALLEAAGLAQLALVLRSIRLMKKQSTDDTAQPALQRDPEEWKTGDEPMTDAQRSYLETLCRETAEEFDATLRKAEASTRIDRLRSRSPMLSHQRRGVWRRRFGGPPPIVDRPEAWLRHAFAMARLVGTLEGLA